MYRHKVLVRLVESQILDLDVGLASTPAPVRCVLIELWRRRTLNANVDRIRFARRR